jgi:esterase/lipase
MSHQHLNTPPNQGMKMDYEDIKDILHKPLIEKLKDMQEVMQYNLDAIYKNSMIFANQDNMVEYARVNGQIWELQFAKEMLDIILCLEERRKIWGKEKESDIKE